MLLLVALCALLVLVAGGCAGDEGQTLVFDDRPPTTAWWLSAAPPTTVAGQRLGPWVDVTGNLAGMPSDCGNLGYVTGHPDTDQVIAAVALNGLWANDPVTQEWLPLGGASPGVVANGTASIVFDRVAPNQFWASGSYTSPGAFRTTDGGQAFEPLGDIEHLDGLSVDMSDPGHLTMLAGSHERADLFRSTDGGATWTNLAPNLPPAIGFASQPLVLGAEEHLLGTFMGETPGIFRTPDGGLNWEQVHTTGVVGLPLVSRDGASIYWPQTDGGLASSSDRGLTWRSVAPPGTLSSYNIIELADRRLASVSTKNVIVSSNQGGSWRSLGPPLPLDGANGLAYSEARNAIFVWKNDCGDAVLPGAVQRLDLALQTG
jgi:photosystem II stability/assembly factor-like uncharacterized protein